ncbi:unnamed protein product [Schistosoma turkestanicum]|nr:unnamed protein product [Schistosoma turkestanicum]
MGSLKCFILGFQEFLTTPLRLWRMHYHLTQFTSNNVHNTKIHEHQRERQKRLQIRIPSSDRLTNIASQIEHYSSSYYSSSVEKLSKSNIDSGISPSNLSPSSLPSSPELSSSSSSTTTTSQIKRSSSDSLGLLEPLARVWLINVGLILVLAIVLYIFSLIPLNPSLVLWFKSSRVCQFVHRLCSCSVHIALLLFMELVNLLYLKVSTTFEGFLSRIIDNWTYFFGYGLPLGCASIIFPHFIGWGGVILAIGYPLLVIGALGSSSCLHPFDMMNMNLKNEWKLFRLLRYCLMISLRPALWISNLVVQTTAWLVYQFWFRQNYSLHVD